MWKTDCQKKGFTLVELLVVISIVAMMSVLAVGGYTDYRQSALLNFSVDDLKSRINEAREKTVKGIGLVEGENSRCYGLYFKRVGEDFELRSFWQEYSGKKVWENEAWEFEGCGVFDGDGTLVAMDKAATIDGLFLDDVEITSDYVIRFEPVEGRVEVGNPRSGIVGSGEKLKVVVRFGKGSKVKTQSFVYDLKSLTTSDE